MALTSEPSLATYKDQIGKTPLHHCAEMNAQKFGLNVRSSLKTARALLAAGADVNAIRIIIDDGEEFYASPLWYAVAWGKNFDLARLLLESGARPDDNAVGSAIWDQDLRMVTLLHQHGGNIDHQTRGETPLLRTVKSRRMKLIEFLVRHGADINFQDAEGFSALHYAAKGNHTLAEVEVLLNCGARPDARAKDGSTPITIADVRRRTGIVRLLESS